MSGTWQRKSLEGVVSGPFELGELTFLARRGKLRPEELVRAGEGQTWLPASDVEDLRGFFDIKQPAKKIEERAPAPPRPESRSSGRPPPVAPMAVSGQEPDQHDNQWWIVGGVLATAMILAGVMLIWLLLRRSPDEPEIAETKPAAAASERPPPSAVAATESPPRKEAGNKGTAAADAPAPGDDPPEPEVPTGAPVAASTPATVPVAVTEPAQPNATAPAAPSSGSQKPMDVERRDSFISIGALSNTIDHALSGEGPANAPADLQGRTTKRDSEFLRKRGADPRTEAAVYRGLEWLAKHQAPDGSWSLQAFSKAAQCECSAPGHAHSDTAATALGLLPFLGAGEVFAGSKYHSHATKALTWIIADQKSDGSFGHIGSGNFYAHAIATLALGEAYGMTGEGALGQSAQLAIDYIVAAQHSAGGWRYDAGMAGDLSVTGWQIMALRSGQIAELSVAPNTMINADSFLDHLQCDRMGSTYGYLGADQPTACRTAIGLLCREYLGWKKDNPGLRLGSNQLLTALPTAKDPNIYYYYYGTLVMHHLGGPGWQRWNDAIKPALLTLQATAGHETGSWKPEQDFDVAGGRLYMTALAVCTLEVYYRYLPLYQTEGRVKTAPAKK